MPKEGTPRGSTDADIVNRSVNPDAVSKVVDENGEPLVFREESNGQRALDFFDDSTVTTEKAIRTPAFNAGPDSLSKDGLYQWWHSVNPDTVSKMVDGNGEPTSEAIKGEETTLQAQSFSDLLIDARFSGLAGEALRREAKRYFQSSLLHQGASVTTVDGRSVKFTMRGYREMQHHSADPRVLQIIPSLPEMLRKAVPLWSEPHTEAEYPNIRAWHHYGIKLKLKGREFYVRLLVREDNDGHTHYDADAISVEVLGNKNGEESSSQPDRKPSAGEDQTALARNRLYQWWHSVNPDPSKHNPFQGIPNRCWHRTESLPPSMRGSTSRCGLRSSSVGLGTGRRWRSEMRWRP